MVNNGIVSVLTTQFINFQIHEETSLNASKVAHCRLLDCSSSLFTVPDKRGYRISTRYQVWESY